MSTIKKDFKEILNISFNHWGFLLLCGRDACVCINEIFLFCGFVSVFFLFLHSKTRPGNGNKIGQETHTHTHLNLTLDPIVNIPMARRSHIFLFHTYIIYVMSHLKYPRVYILTPFMEILLRRKYTRA